MFGPPPPVPPAFVVIGPPQFGPAFKPTHGDARGLIYGLPPGYAPAPTISVSESKTDFVIEPAAVIKYGEHVIRWTINHEISTLSIHTFSK